MSLIFNDPCEMSTKDEERKKSGEGREQSGKTENTFLSCKKDCKTLIKWN